MVFMLSSVALYVADLFLSAECKSQPLYMFSFLIAGCGLVFVIVAEYASKNLACAIFLPILSAVAVYSYMQHTLFANRFFDYTIICVQSIILILLMLTHLSIREVKATKKAQT